MSNSDNIDNQEAVKLEATGARLVRADGWYSDNGGATWHNPAPNAAPSMCSPYSRTVTIDRNTTPANLDAPDNQEGFQTRVDAWLLACFGEEIARDRTERNHRFLEEALELVQACGCTSSEAHQLVDYTFGRPVGERGQEVGGVMNTLAALCLAYGLDMAAEGDTEIARCWEKIDRIREKQRNKPKHSPLPGPDNQEALAGEGVEAYVFATCVECTSPAACASRRFCGVGTHRVALQEEWRCVDCKRVFRCAEEPVRCPIGGCQGRTFAPVARTLPSNEALGDDRNGVEGLWQPIETAPKDGRLILLGWPNWDQGVRVSRWKKNAQEWTWDGSHHYRETVGEPSLWMPLPSLSRTPSSPQADEADVERVGEWRCIECKATFACAVEPVRCPIGDCKGRTFANFGTSTMTTRPAGVEEAEHCTTCLDRRFVLALLTDQTTARISCPRCSAKPAALPKEGEEAGSIAAALKGPTAKEHGHVLAMMLAGIPYYEGDDPRAHHYQRQRAALEYALFSLPVSGEVDHAAVIRRAEAAEADWQAASGEVERLRACVETCRDTFDSYAEMHGKKLPAAEAYDPHSVGDILKKVKRNADLAAMCRAALTPQQATEEGV